MNERRWQRRQDHRRQGLRGGPARPHRAAGAALQAKHGFTPGLAVVLVGEDPASKVYVKNKGEQTRSPA